MYLYDQRPGTTFTTESRQLFEQLRNSEYSVLVGRNNCGKSYILKTLTHEWGQNASYLGPARYQNFNLLGYFTPNRNRKNEKFMQFVHQWNQSQLNIDNSPVNLQQAIAELSDEQRDKLTEMVKLLLGVEMQFEHTLPNNSMSQKYIKCGSHNISFCSSGLRLITALITGLLDTDYDTFLIDEPELGISPEAQGILAEFMFDRGSRSKYFPHAKSIIFATHSSIFLDRQQIENNYQVEKVGDEISIRQTITLQDFNKIHFFLLGNRFETLFLPSLIVIVEGKSDHIFIDRILQIKYPTSQFSVISANADNRVKEILNIAKALLVDLQRSPYRDRIIVVIDSVHAAGLPDTLEKMGLPKESIIIWGKNGIEYYYPPTLLAAIFGGNGPLEIVGDSITSNGVTYTKAELASNISKQLTDSTPMHESFQRQFLSLIESKLQGGT